MASFACETLKLLMLVPVCGTTREKVIVFD